MLAEFGFSPPMDRTLAILLRLFIAALLGAVIGFERESHGRAAGLRTTMLACLAACVASILSETLFDQSAVNAPPGTWRPDPARLAQGVLAGMGFLGAGVVVREGKIIRGVTTAAVLWFVTIIGLTIGAGYYTLGILGWAFAMLALVVMPVVERYASADWYGNLAVTLTGGGVTDQQVREAIQRTGAVVKDFGFDVDLSNQVRTLRIAIKYKRGGLIALADSVREVVEKLPGVTRVTWQLA